LKGQAAVLFLCFVYTLGQRLEFISWMGETTVKKRPNEPLMMYPPAEKTSSRKGVAAVLHPIVELLLTCHIQVGF
jgi:hypothetical protein